MRQKIENEKYLAFYGNDYIEGLFLEVFKKNEDGAPGKRLFIRRSKCDKLFDISAIVKDAEQFGFDLSYELIDDDDPRWSGSGCGGGCEECRRRWV